MSRMRAGVYVGRVSRLVALTRRQECGASRCTLQNLNVEYAVVRIVLQSAKHEPMTRIADSNGKAEGEPIRVASLLTKKFRDHKNRQGQAEDDHARTEHAQRMSSAI